MIKWEIPGREGKEVLPNGDLFLQNLQKNDSGEYRCSIAREDKIVSKIHLNVNSKPILLLRFYFHLPFLRLYFIFSKCDVL